MNEEVENNELPEAEKPINWDALKKKFDPAAIELLPRVTCNDCVNNRGTCSVHPQRAKCQACGAVISPQHIHLRFVGHAEVTQRLNDTTMDWILEPLAYNQMGGPAIIKEDARINMWVKLTIGNRSRIGVGTVLLPTRKNQEVEKELIGDALRNAAMRFGVGLELWMRNRNKDIPTTHSPQTAPAPIDASQVSEILAMIESATVEGDLIKVAKILRTKPDAFKDKVRPTYDRKLDFLKKQHQAAVLEQTTKANSAEDAKAQSTELESTPTQSNTVNPIDLAEDLEQEINHNVELDNAKNPPVEAPRSKKARAQSKAKITAKAS